MTAGLAVAGSGPAGLAAAFAAASAGVQTSVFERMPDFGTKLLASGGGKCNLSNTLANHEMVRAFGENGSFLRPSLNRFPNEFLFRILRENGVNVKAADGFHYFPESGKASDVRDAFLNACRRLGVQFSAHSPVVKIETAAGRITGIVTSSGEAFPVKALVLACGGKAWPKLGGTESGLMLAQSIGHTVETPFPAMAPLIVSEAWPGTLAGITLPCAGLWFEHRGKTFRKSGELLFTHSGFSGPCALDLAGELAQACAEAPEKTVPLCFSVNAKRDSAAWTAFLNARRSVDGAKLVRTVLSSEMPSSLAAELCRESCCSETKVCELTADQRKLLTDNLTGFRFRASGSGPMECAMAMKGGVRLSEVDPKTLESRIVRGVYFAGEILDLAGPCGGYNIRWAFSSGFNAGTNAAAALR